jgi:hypothetical protein
MDLQFHVFVKLTLVESEWSASRPGLFVSGGNSPPYPLGRRLGGPQDWYGRRGEEKELLSC